MIEKDINKAMDLTCRKIALLQIKKNILHAKHPINLHVFNIDIVLRGGTLLQAIESEVSYINRNLKIIGIKEIE